MHVKKESGFETRSLILFCCYAGSVHSCLSVMTNSMTPPFMTSECDMVFLSYGFPLSVMLCTYLLASERFLALTVKVLPSGSFTMASSACGAPITYWHDTGSTG